MIKNWDIARFLCIVIVTIILGLTLAACDDEPEFRITGTVDGLGTRRISMVYAADGKLHTETTTGNRRQVQPHRVVARLHDG